MQKNSIAVFSAFVAASFATNPFAFAADPVPRNAGAVGSDIALCGFEAFEVGSFAPAAGSGWTAGDDAATIVDYKEGEGYSGAAPKPFEGVGDNYLSVEDEVTMTAVSTNGVTYIDALVQFPSASASEPSSFPEDAKFCLWLQADGENTNLCARGSYYDYVNGAFTATPTNYVLTAENFSIEPGAWHHVSVTSYDSVANLGTEEKHQYTPGFVVSVDGKELGVDEEELGVDNVDRRMSTDAKGQMLASNINGLIHNPSFIPSIAGIGDAGTVQSVGFHGSGLVDDVVVTTIDPAANLFTFSWPKGLESVKYVIGGITNTIESVSATNITVAVSPGAAVSIIGSLGYRDVERAGNTSSDTSLTLPALGPDYYFSSGAGTVADPFQIANVDDLKALRAAVAAGYGASSNYVQTADIALDEAWPGIGIQNGKDIVATAEFDNGAFTGTYDGGNYTISNFQMVDGLDYCGLFNSVKDATIKNLKVSYKDGSFAKDMAAANDACGATFVGVAKGSTLQNLTSLAGTVSCTKGFGGIVGYLMAGSTVDSCTNNVNLTSTKTNKAGGIAMITQGGTGSAIIRNCQNNGTTTGNANQKGGIVGYVGVATTIENCEDTAGSTPSFLHHQTGTLTLSGVNKAPAGVKSYTKNSTNIDGLLFAAIDGNVATFVHNADLALGNTYKAMGPGAAYKFTQVGSITFDQSLVSPSVTCAAGLKVTSSGTGVVTYTAEALATVTVTVTGGANATAVWTVNGEQVASAPATLTEGDTYSVTYTANEGYEFAEGAVTSASGTVGTEAISIAIDDATAVAADYKVVIDGADVTIEPTPEDLASLAAAGVDTSSAEAVNEFLAGDIGTTGVKVWQALFLGLEPTAAGLDQFEISSIDIAADGSVSVEMPDLALMTGRGVDIVISVVASDDIGGDWSAATPVATATNSTVLPKATPAQGETFKFYKVKASFSASAPVQEQQGE